MAKRTVVEGYIVTYRFDVPANNQLDAQAIAEREARAWAANYPYRLGGARVIPAVTEQTRCVCEFCGAEWTAPLISDRSQLNDCCDAERTDHAARMEEHDAKIVAKRNANK